MLVFNIHEIIQIYDWGRWLLITNRQTLNRNYDAWNIWIDNTNLISFEFGQKRISVADRQNGQCLHDIHFHSKTTWWWCYHWMVQLIDNIFYPVICPKLTLIQPTWLHIRITWFSLYGIRIPLFSLYGIHMPLLPYMVIQPIILGMALLWAAMDSLLYISFIRT